MNREGCVSVALVWSPGCLIAEASRLDAAGWCEEAISRWLKAGDLWVIAL